MLENDPKELLKKYIISSLGNIDHLERIYKYYNHLIQQNIFLNLISRKLNSEDIIKDHFFDCLIGAKYFLPFSSVTDIGSGGGMPGVLLAIVYPDKKFFLVEKSLKKSAFLKETVKVLDLKNVEIKNCMIDQYEVISEVITCRAFKSIFEIINLTKDFYNRNGKYILYKGTRGRIIDELDSAGSHFKINYTIYKIDEIKDKERNIIKISKK